jgi:hypothetical protein
MTEDICQELVPYINRYLLMITVTTFVMLLALLEKNLQQFSFAGLPL